ncbi:hypothetical protein PJE062_2564 [Pseudovibrio sp. JE062]|nr:hypothetical protein PJE062_2564 [Pseudovibrio sp. JE062]
MWRCKPSLETKTQKGRACEMGSGSEVAQKAILMAKLDIETSCSISC